MLLKPSGVVAAAAATTTGAEVGDYDPAHPINQGLALMIGSHPAGSPLLGVELVSGAALQTIGPRIDYAGGSVFGGLKCARLPATTATADGLYLADAAALAALKAALENKTAWSLHMRFYISAPPPDYQNVLGWPLGTSWTDPYANVELSRNANTNSWWHPWKDSSAVHTPSSPTFAAGEWAAEWSVGVVRSGDTAQWYRDGAAWGSAITGQGASNVLRWPGTLQPFTLMNRSSTDPYPHAWEWRLSQARIWNRALSAQEMADAHGNLGVVV